MATILAFAGRAKAATAFGIHLDVRHAVPDAAPMVGTAEQTLSSDGEVLAAFAQPTWSHRNQWSRQ